MSQLKTNFTCLNYSKLYSEAAIIFQEDESVVRDPLSEKVDDAFKRMFPHLDKTKYDHIDDEGDNVIYSFEIDFYINKRTIVFIGHSYPGNSDIRVAKYDRV